MERMDYIYNNSEKYFYALINKFENDANDYFDDLKSALEALMVTEDEDMQIVIFEKGPDPMIIDHIDYDEDNALYYWLYGAEVTPDEIEEIYEAWTTPFSGDIEPYKNADYLKTWIKDCIDLRDKTNELMKKAVYWTDEDIDEICRKVIDLIDFWGIPEA